MAGKNTRRTTPLQKVSQRMGAIRYAPDHVEHAGRLRSCSTDTRDLTAQRRRLRELGVDAQRIYLDHGLIGTTCARPGLDHALAAVRSGDTLVVTKLARLARSVPDARAIGDALAARRIRLSLDGQVYDPTDPLGKMFFATMVTFAEFEIDLMWLRTCEGTVVARPGTQTLGNLGSGELVVAHGGGEGPPRR